MLTDITTGILETVDRVQQWVLIVTSLFIALLMFIQVMLRYVFFAPLMGIEEVLPLAAFWLYFIGASYASHTRTHIRAEVVDVMLRKDSALRAVRFSASIITVAVGLVFVGLAFQFVLYSLRTGRFSATLFIPTVYSETAILVGLVLMVLYSAIELRDRFQLLRSHEEH